MRRLLPILFLAFACSSKSNLHVPSPAWPEQVVYMVMTDRFADGDPSNDDQHKGEYDPADINKYSGGDLQGIVDKLDYIQGLGATAIWITPPVANMWWDPLQQSGGYHGYWARNLKKVDEHLGTLDTYKKLSSELHKRGMYLIQDVVPNHMGNFFQYSSYNPLDVTQGYVPNTNAAPGGKPEQAPFDQDDPRVPAQKAAAIYHWTPAIVDYNDPNQELNYQISDLDDLNTENPEVRKALKDSYGYWIKEVGVDAFRVDTAKFVPHDFWNDFFHAPDGILAAAKSTGRNDFLAFGEVYEIPPALDDALEHKVSSFLGTPATPELPAVLAFPLYGEIGRVFAQGKPTSYMTYRLGKFMDPSLYPDPYRMPTFLDNHDVQRFLSLGSEKALQQALAFLFTVPGIPIVYYGTEQKFIETRAAMFAGGYKQPINRYDTNSGLYKLIQQLASLRKAHKAFTHGTLEVLSDNQAGPGALAYRRSGDGETALVLMNTADENVLVSALDTRLPAGTVLDVLQSQQDPPPPAIGPGGLLQMIVPARGVLVALATSQVATPPVPAAAIAVSTALEGQTFANDVTVSGTISPADKQLWMVLDSYVSRPVVIHPAADGSWSVTMPISDFPPGLAAHTVTFYSPDAQVATKPYPFHSNVVCTPQVVSVSDPAGDDKGPAGTYRYPQDSTFGHQMDITGVRAEVCRSMLTLKVTLADWSTVWNPTLHFDHVAFNVFFSVPGNAGTTAMPMLNGTAPFGWSFDQFTYGWQNAMYTSSGATTSQYGATAEPPGVSADAASKTVTFTYLRKSFGVPSWTGMQVYVTTWDFDGIKGIFRPLSQAGGQWEMGGGAPTDPLIMDDVPPITLP